MTLASRDQIRLRAVAEELTAVGCNVTLELRGCEPVQVGAGPERTRVRFASAEASRALLRRDQLALAEAYMNRGIQVEGDFIEVIKSTEVFHASGTPWSRMREVARLALGSGRAMRRDSIAFHYDRPADFFLPWFERWRSYSHGFYDSEGDSPEDAQARKLQFSLDALNLKPGMNVFDMGAGWGAFIEYAGLRGICVHGITLSREQHGFVSRLIAEKDLPCTIELVDFLDHEPIDLYDAAVFMGTFEHVPNYRWATRFLSRRLKPGARVYADFCGAPGSQRAGAFLARHIWPGQARFVRVDRLVAAFRAEGFDVQELADDTRSYEWTVRDWADALDECGDTLGARFGEESVRAFRIYLRASQYFFLRRWTQAHHLVASLESARPVEPRLRLSRLGPSPGCADTG